MKRLSICWIIGCLLELVACRPEVPTQAEQGETDVFPDYREVTVPVNMAPPNFKLVDQQLQGIIIAVFFPDIGCGTRWGFINDVLKTMLKSLFLITNRQIIVV